MKIIKLQAENFKKLKAVEIVPDESGTVILKGRNAQGKSSVLNAIVAGLTGQNFSEPIRDGQGNAEVKIELDEIIITRKWTNKNSYLIVTSKNGDKYASPQKMLDNMTNVLAFDPSAIVTMKQSEQIQILKKITGIDTTEYDETIKNAFDERTIVNREADAYKKRYEACPAVNENVPPEEISINELTAKLEEINTHNKKVDEKLLSVEKFKAGIEKVAEEIEDQSVLIEQYQIEIDELNEKINNAKLKRNELETTAKEMEEQLDNYKVPEKKSDKEVIEQIKAIDETNQKIKDNKQSVELFNLWKEKEEESKKLTAEIETAKKSKIETIQNAKMPIAGLYFDNDGIKFNGKSLESCSDAEKIKIGLSIALASNPKIKVIIMRQGSFLDDDSLKLVADMAKQTDAQVWIEKVGTGGEQGIIIEDGEVEPEF